MINMILVGTSSIAPQVKVEKLSDTLTFVIGFCALFCDICGRVVRAMRLDVLSVYLGSGCRLLSAIPSCATSYILT
jgi:hypothetical protein